MAVLQTRSAVAAAEGAAVVGSYKRVTLAGSAAVGLNVTLTGSPTTYTLRAVVEGSFDGVSWHKLVRFKDVTNTVTGNRFVRCPGVTAASTADVAADTLTAAEATGTQIDIPWPPLLRAATRLESLSGGTAPTVTANIYVESG